MEMTSKGGCRVCVPKPMHLARQAGVTGTAAHRRDPDKNLEVAQKFLQVLLTRNPRIPRSFSARGPVPDPDFGHR